MANLLPRWPFTKHQHFTSWLDIFFLSNWKHKYQFLHTHLPHPPEHVILFILGLFSLLPALFLFSMRSTQHDATCLLDLFCCQSLLAVDVVGGASEGTAGWCVCRVGGSSAGPDQTFRPAAADHPAGYSQCHQGGGGPDTTAQVTTTYTCSCLHITIYYSF